MPPAAQDSTRSTFGESRNCARAVTCAVPTVTMDKMQMARESEEAIRSPEGRLMGVDSVYHHTHVTAAKAIGGKYFSVKVPCVLPKTTLDSRVTAKPPSTWETLLIKLNATNSCGD